MHKIILLLSLLSFSFYSVAENSNQRIISTDAAVTELLFALGADQQLVAVDVTSKLPKEYRKLANIGYHRTLSVEGLLALNPDLIIGSEHMGPPTTIEILEKSSVRLIQLPAADSIATLQENIKLLGKTISRNEQAASLLSQLNEQVKRLQQDKLQGKRVAFLLSMEPGKLRMAGSNTAGHSFIHLINGSNVASHINYQNISAESLLALNPDIILVAGRDSHSAVKELLQANPVLNSLPAAKNQQIIAVNAHVLIAGISIAAVTEAIRTVENLNQQLSRN